MAKINERPDIIYVRDMTETDKDNFQKIYSKLHISNNSGAVKKLFSEYLRIEKVKTDQANEIIRLNKELENSNKALKKFQDNKENVLKGLAGVEAILKEAKQEIIKIK